VIAADVSTGSQRTVAGCKDGCRLITRFDVSADGGWIAYHLVMCGEKEECRPSDPTGGLWVVGAEGEPRLVLPTPRVLVDGVDPSFRWSPTGAQLAYSDVDELILLDPTTWDRTRIAVAGGTISRISWGPDGRSIAYAVEQPSTGNGDAASSGVFVVRSGRQPHQVTDTLGTVGIGWSPDGRSLVLDVSESDRSVIEVIAADGSEKRILVEGSTSDGPGAPVWSPDGSRIAFIRTLNGGLSVEVWVIGADGRGEVRLGLATGLSWRDGPVWSPDSQLVAWSSAAPGRWVAADADRGGSAQSIDWLQVERWRQG
jgi:Tol biopolymer transport system component